MPSSKSARDAARPEPARALGTFIREKLLRSEKYLTQVELASAARVSEQVLSALLTAARPVPWETVKHIVDALDTEKAWRTEAEQLWRRAYLAWRDPSRGDTAAGESPSVAFGRSAADAADSDVAGVVVRDQLRWWCAAEAAWLRALVARLPHIAGHPDPTGRVVDALVGVRPRKQTPAGSVGDVYSPRAEQDLSTGRIMAYRELLALHRRVVLLGDPGMGKSWLLILHAIDLLEDASRQLENPATDWLSVQLPLFIRCDSIRIFAAESRDLEPAGGTALATAVVKVVMQRYARNAAAELWPWLEQYVRSGPAVILLDALDEAPASDRPALARLLHRSDETPGRVVVASRHAGYSASVFPAQGRCEAEVLPLTRIDDYINSWSLPADRRLELDQRLRHPAVAMMAKIPLLLAFLCHLAAGSHESLPAARSGLYGRILRRFLRGEHRSGDPIPHSRLPVDPIEREHELLATLRPLAYAIAASPQGWRDRISEAELQRHLLDVPRPAGLSPAQTLRAISVETGILIPDGDLRDGRNPPYMFIHRTMAEYLVAEHIAANPDVMDRCAQTHLHLAADWREVWLLAAGIEPRRTLKQLLDHDHDPLHLALRLAAAAVTQLSVEQKADVDDLIAVIQDRAQRLLHAPGSHRRVRELTAVALGQLGAPALPVLADALGREDLFKCAVDGLVHLGAPAVPLLANPIEPEKNQRFSGTSTCHRALGRIRDPEAVTALVDALLHTEHDSAGHAAEALAVIGDPSAVPGLLKALFAPHLKWSSWRSIGHALARIDPRRAFDEIAARLDDRDPDIRRRAACGLGTLNDIAAVPLLIPMLADDSTDVVYEVLNSLREIPSPEAVPALRTLLHDRDRIARHRGVRNEVIYALRAIGEDVVDAVIDDAVKSGVTLQEMAAGPDDDAITAPATTHLYNRFPESFLGLLDHPRPEVRERTAKTILMKDVPYLLWKGAYERLGGLPESERNELARFVFRLRLAGESAVEDLTAALQNSDRCVWGVAGLAAIGSLPAIERLTITAASPDRELRRMALAALAVPGLPISEESPMPVMARNTAVDADRITQLRRCALERALTEQDQHTRVIAATALAGLGNDRGASILVNALKENQKPLRFHAAWGLSRIGSVRDAPTLFALMAATHSEVGGSRDATDALTRLGIPAVLHVVDRIQRGPYSREFTADVIDLAFGYFADRTTTVDIRPSALSSLQGLTQLADGPIAT
ncbi:HEAT repeat domain-containing protein [Nocardia asiatica]|uniref:HEAT repeat domain-containing protein n=1 Tax=Nocardia asiatica TaxID=209252 RepID=UPI00245890EC|nr:HEAT repeat domain-containing protein [Nocardia asiatica]